MSDLLYFYAYVIFNLKQNNMYCEYLENNTPVW